MANDKQIDYEVTASVEGFEAGMKKSVESAKAARDQIEGHFTKVGDLLAGQFGMIAKVMTLVGGGVYFKSAIDETKKLTGEANMLAKALNISATEASILNTALGDVYSDAETYVTSSQKLAKTLRTDEEALNAMGLATRDANGEYKNMNDLMQDAIVVLNGYREGTDRTLAAQTLFGKGAGEVAGLLKLNSKVMEEAKVKAESLNLTISEEGVAANKKYKAAMNDLGDVMAGMKKTVGEALMPVFSDLAEYFSSTGPQKVSIMKVVMESLVVVFRGVELAVYSLWRTVKMVWDNIVTISTGFASIMKAIFKGEYAEALELGKKYLSEFKNNGITAFTDIGNKAVEVNDKINKMMAPRTAAKASSLEGKKSYVDPKGGSGGSEQSIMAQLEEQLALKKDAFEREQQALGAMRDFSKQQERDYWANILATVKLGQNDRIAVSRKTLALEHDLRKQAFEADIADRKSQLENFKKDHVAKIVILEEIREKMRAAYGDGSVQERTAQGEINKERRLGADQSLKIERDLSDARRSLRLGEIEEAERQSAFEVQTMQRSALSQIQSLTGLEEEKYRIKRAALLEEQAALTLAEDFDREAMAKNQAAREELEKQHQMRLSSIKRQEAIESRKYELEAFGGISRGLESAIAATLKGTQSIGGMFKAMFKAILDAVANMLAKMATEWIINLAREKLMGALTALSQIKNHAAVAGAAAFASTAAIPIVGPELAPGVAAASASSALSFASFIPFAARGYDIPAGINPLTQLHQKEMVLPAEHAETIRDMAGKGGSSVNFHVSAIDARSVKQFFEDNGDMLVRTLRTKQLLGA